MLSRAHNLKIGDRKRIEYVEAIIECSACGVSSLVFVAKPLPDTLACPVCQAVMERGDDIHIPVQPQAVSA